MKLTTAFVTTIAAAAMASGCEGDQGPPGGIDPNLPALEKAFAGVGGQDALVELAGFRITASGERLMSLEGYRPHDDSVPTSTFTTDVAADLAGERLRIAYHRTIPLFGAETDYRVIVNGDVGVIDGVESIFGVPGGDLSSDRWASTVRQHRLLDPQLILRDIALGTATAIDAGLAVKDGELRHRIDVADPVRPLSLFVDRYTGELTDVATLENDHVAGDTPLEVHYLGWRTWDGAVRFPSEVVITLGDQPLHVEHRDSVTTTGPLDDALFAFPAGAAPQHVAADAARGARNSQFLEAFAGIGVPLEGLQTFVDAHEVAPGVWHLRGGSHNSLAIEQANGVVLVEAPLYEARAQAILAWVEATFPGKSVTHVVSTHHHRDHTGALRTFVARGARVVLGEEARAFFTAAFRAPHTIEPDELAAAPRAPAFDAVSVGGALTLADPVRPVQVVHVVSTHAADLVIAYIPAARLVFVSDIYNPGLPANPYGARELLEVIEARGLAVDTIAGGHGGVGPRSDLEAAAGT